MPYLDTIHGITMVEGRYTHEMILASQFTSLRVMLKVSAAARDEMVRAIIIKIGAKRTVRSYGSEPWP
jgi:hypothetical protein